MAAEIEPPYPLIHEELKSGMVVPFLGAGASRSKSGEASAALPSAGELSLLAREDHVVPERGSARPR